MRAAMLIAAVAVHLVALILSGCIRSHYGVGATPTFLFQVRQDKLMGPNG